MVSSQAVRGGSAMKPPKWKPSAKPKRRHQAKNKSRSLAQLKIETDNLEPKPPTPQEVQRNLLRRLPLAVLQKKFNWLRENTKTLSTWDLERALEKAIRRRKGLPPLHFH